MSPATCVQGMDASAYFENAVYREQSPAATEYFDAKVPSIFVPDASQSWLEVYSSHASQSAQSRHTAKHHDTKQRFSSNLSNRSAQVRSYQSDLDYPPEKETVKCGGAEPDDQERHSGFYSERLEDEARLEEFLRTGRESPQRWFGNCELTLSRYLARVSAYCASNSCFWQQVMS
jgi:hypothetical protein